MILQPIQSKSIRALSITLIVVVLASLPAAALAATGDTTRVSVATDGTQGNKYSSSPAISADGRYVAFSSQASNLVSGDTNGWEDVFLRDTLIEKTILISVASHGSQGNEFSDWPTISADGRYVTFQSDASNLVPGDTNGSEDIFLRDTLNGTTSLVSVASNGTQGNWASSNPVISADGRYVVFESVASNLVPGDTNGCSDVFLRDTLNGTTRRTSVASDGTQQVCVNGIWQAHATSGDGRYVVFNSSASNLVPGDTNGYSDIFLRDTPNGTTTRLSVASDGSQGNSDSFEPAISDNGRYVVFVSGASNLVPGDTNGFSDIFLCDMLNGTITRVSVASDGTQENRASSNPAISADGRYVAFSSLASNLVLGDTNGARDVFLRDTLNGITTRLSVASDGMQGNSYSDGPAISSDRRYVAFTSNASNLVAGDTNGTSDIFVHELDYPAAPVTVPATGFAPDRLTALPPQSVSYADFSKGSKQGLGDLWLEIPRLGVQMNIVGVPQVEGKWDVSWLGQNAGWLNGSTFPTWKGNSVLTGHVYDAYGQPGPFRYLSTLWYGDKVIVHAWGGEYVYEVRGVSQVSPDNTAAMLKHEELPWVTLVTCRGYDEASNSYKYRVLVRAVLVEVK